MKVHEQIWLDKVNAIIDRNLNNSGFTVSNLASELSMSVSPFYKKMVQLTGQPPKQYFRFKRLERAKDLLERGVFPTVLETTHAVGFKHSYYFSQLFQKEFGKKPIEYLK